MLLLDQLLRLLPVVAALASVAVLAYKFWKAKAKINEVKEACKAAINANKEMVPLVDDERLKIALETKISVLQLLMELIEGGIIRDNFVWELDEKVKSLGLR
jgi:hypothetical protein